MIPFASFLFFIAKPPKERRPRMGTFQTRAALGWLPDDATNRQTVPKSLSASIRACIPAPDAKCQKPSRIAPMTSGGKLSFYGGLVPLGFPHSKTCGSCPYAGSRLCYILAYFTRKRNPFFIFPLTNWTCGGMLISGKENNGLSAFRLGCRSGRRIVNRV